MALKRGKKVENALDLMIEMAIIGACAFEQHLEK